MKNYLKNKSFIAGISLFLFLLVFYFVGKFFLYQDCNLIDLLQKQLAPSKNHLFGTDHLGRDLLSRILVGLEISTFIGFCVTIIACTTGTVLGAISGYFGGITDSVIKKITDAQMSFPGLLLSLMLIAVFGTGTTVTILSLSLINIPRFTRITRSNFIKYKDSLFVKAAITKGASWQRIIFIHIFPNVLPDILVTCSLTFSLAILSESGLSYLGLGVQPPSPSFGRILSEAQRFIIQSPSNIIIPAIVLIILILSFNLIGDGISEVNKH